MKGLHFFTGEKGGIGKSLAACGALEYCISHNIDYIFYDADRTSPDVGLIYDTKKYEAILSQDRKKTEGYVADEPNKNKKREQQIYFSEDQEDVFLADILFEQAMEKLVIVNLPAQVDVMVSNWLQQRGVLTLAEEADVNVNIYYWFLTDGSNESLELLQKSLERFEKRVKHIVVRNLGLNKRVAQLIEDHKDVKAAIDIYTEKVIDLPYFALSKEEKNLLKVKKLKLSDAVKRDNRNGLSLISKQRIKNFLNQWFEQIGSTEIWGTHQPQQSNVA